ncbi:MAG TPA: HAD-IA family hydrolase [Fimbriimonas sp.]|nr:HAD-IA family hydrolase [Fimbriimonas sp.]
MPKDRLLTPKLITFDCANTLIWTDWSPESFAVRCCGIAGVPLPDRASQEYLRLLAPKMAEFHALNRSGTLVEWREFWVQQISDWLDRLGIVGQDPLALHLVGEREIFETPSHTFKLFDDVVPCLTGLKATGIPMAVISNWDLSLHKCMEAHGILVYFDAVWASLVFGAEKPDARFFAHAYNTFHVRPEECIHVGDLVVDDYDGARAAGMNAVLIDRGSGEPSRERGTISSLSQLGETFDWFD